MGLHEDPSPDVFFVVGEWRSNGRHGQVVPILAKLLEASVRRNGHVVQSRRAWWETWVWLQGVWAGWVAVRSFWEGCRMIPFLLVRLEAMATRLEAIATRLEAFFCLSVLLFFSLWMSDDSFSARFRSSTWNDLLRAKRLPCRGFPLCGGCHQCPFSLLLGSLQSNMN